MHVSQHQLKRLGTFDLTRNGLTVPNADAIKPGACWNFALTGSVLSMRHANSPAEIYEGTQGNNGVLDVNIWPLKVNGLKRTAERQYANCGAELRVLKAQINNAIGGNVGAQNACREAMVKIVARRNGLTPGGNGTYKLHMRSKSWFGWDHWGLSLKPPQPGRPRVYIQTVTGSTLQHACNTIWDEHLHEVVIDIQQLHQTQVGLIDKIKTYGDRCIECAGSHGAMPSSPFNAWHRCDTCRVVYCPSHGKVLAGKQGKLNRTRACAQPGCNGRTSLGAYV